MITHTCIRKIMIKQVQGQNCNISSLSDGAKILFSRSVNTVVERQANYM